MLKQALLTEEAVQGLVTITTAADSTGESERVDVLVIDTLGIDEAHGKLDSAVLGGGDELASGRALPGDVKVDELALVVLHRVRWAVPLIPDLPGRFVSMLRYEVLENASVRGAIGRIQGEECLLVW